MLFRSEKLQAKWGKPVVVENRAGGDGLIAIRAFMQAADDHVLLYATSASFIAHPYTLDEKPPYDLERDLLPIARTTETVVTLCVPADFPAKTIAEFVAQARANPGKFNVAGAPGLPEFSVNAFAKENNLDVTKVPYRDVAQAAIDLAEGRIHFVSMSYAVATPHLESKKIRQLATGGTKRSPLTPDIPSAFESGFPVLGLETTVGLFGPSNMPRALRERIAPDVLEALADPAVVKKLVDSGQAVIPQGPDQLAAALRDQTAAAERAAKILGITPKR